MRDCEHHVWKIGCWRTIYGRMLRSPSPTIMPLSFIYRTMCILREKIRNIHNYNNILILYPECVSAFTHKLWKSVAVSTWALFKKCCKKTCVMIMFWQEAVSRFFWFTLKCSDFEHQSPVHCWKYHKQAEKRRFGNCTTCMCKEALFIEIYMRCFMYESKEAQHLGFSHL